MTRLLTAFALLFLASSVTGAQDVDFKSQIKPIFEKHCIACHGPTEDKAFRIDDKDEALGYVIEEDSESSDLYLVMIDEDEDVLMPPPAAHVPMEESDIQLVKAWIDQGANWPDDVGEWEDLPLPKGEEAANDQTEQVKRAAGSLHPAAVHLPIGLLLAAGLFAFLSCGNFVMSDCAYYCLWLGALGAIAACVTGWFFSPMQGWGEVNEVADILDPKKKIYWHRITGLGATVFALIPALFAASARNKDPDDGLMWKLGVMLLAAGIGFVGHKGGELTYGEDHYSDIEALYQSVFPQSKEDGDRTVDDSDDESSADEQTTEAEKSA